MTTILIAVPKSQTKEFLSTYETLTPMVVPRSASLIASDDEYALFNTTLFKKYVNEFTLKAREHKWTPREFKYSEEFIADLRQELQKATEQERKLWGDVVRLSQASYNDIIQNWTHLKATFLLKLFSATVSPLISSTLLSWCHRSIRRRSKTHLLPSLAIWAAMRFRRIKMESSRLTLIFMSTVQLLMLNTSPLSTKNWSFLHRTKSVLQYL